MKTITHSHPVYPFTFQCPDDWEVQSTSLPDRVNFFLRPPRDPQMALIPAISVDWQTTTASTLEELVAQWVERRRAIPTFRLLASSPTLLAQQEARQLDTAHEAKLPFLSTPGTKLTVRESVILALKEGQAYSISYRVHDRDFDRFLPVWQALVASFSLGG